jgi:hypothetical protein
MGAVLGELSLLQSWSHFSDGTDWSLLMKTVRIDQLRPTQMMHGLREFATKRRATRHSPVASSKRRLPKGPYLSCTSDGRSVCH